MHGPLNGKKEAPQSSLSAHMHVEPMVHQCVYTNGALCKKPVLWCLSPNTQKANTFGPGLAEGESANKHNISQIKTSH